MKKAKTANYLCKVCLSVLEITQAVAILWDEEELTVYMK
jgi:hypothetical protein